MFRQGLRAHAPGLVQRAGLIVEAWSLLEAGAGTCGRLACYRSRRVKARRPFWLAGLAGRETPQQEREDGRPGDPAESRGRTPQRLLRRRSQAVQLSLIQAFPVLEVVVQVLHKIGEVCESWRREKTLI
ncbi:hypothetical protein INR49_010335 [Caranx melampygus]|nr:hypothetical protein INR49_010335 [Caranx melampygus]